MEGYGSLCSVRGSFWVQRVVFGFSYFTPVVVFVMLGPGAQLSSLLVRFLFLFWGLGKRELGLGVELSF